MKNIKTGQKNNSEASDFLACLNKEYSKLHTAYENFFWLSYMGDHSVNKKMNKALSERDAFRANEKSVKRTHNRPMNYNRMLFFTFFVYKIQIKFFSGVKEKPLSLD